MKRIALFLLTNIAVLVVISIIVNVLGLDRFLTAEGLNLSGLLVFSAVVGFTGSIISLLISKPMAKISTGARVVDGSEGTTEYWLVATVKKLADTAGIGMISSASVRPVSVNIGASVGFSATHLPANSDNISRTMPIALASSTRCGRIQRR